MANQSWSTRLAATVTGGTREPSLLTPNRQEAERATNISIGTPEDAIDAARSLKSEFEVDEAAITLDREGIALVDRAGVGRHLPPAQSRDVYDITGAGDVVLAVLGLCLAGEAALQDSAAAANCAAGIAVGRLGVVSVSAEELDEGTAKSKQRPTAVRPVGVSGIAGSRQAAPRRRQVDRLDERLFRFVARGARRLSGGSVTTRGCVDCRD